MARIVCICPIPTRRATRTAGSSASNRHETASGCFVGFVVAVGEAAWEEGREPVLEEREDLRRWCTKSVYVSHAVRTSKSLPWGGSLLRLR
jgi:hypothetical protein